MSKTVGQEIRNFINILEDINNRNRDYDFTMEVENWAEQPEDPDDESVPYYLTLGINYSVSGSYQPGTWGYWGGDPPEYPEIDDYEVYNAETGERLENIPKEAKNQIEDAIWNNVEKVKRDAERYPDGPN